MQILPILLLVLAFPLLVASPSIGAGRCSDAERMSVFTESAARCGCTDVGARDGYLRCAKRFVRQAIEEGELERKCRKPALRAIEDSRCGRAKERYADHDGVKIHYVTLGKGPLIVFLHGFPDFWFTWRDQMAAFAEDYQVAAIDLRGYNLSDAPSGVDQYDMTKLVGDVAAVIRDLGAESAIVVGHDWGGSIAWSFAMEHPELTEKLVVLNVPHPRGLARELEHNPVQAANSAYARNFQQEGAHLALSAAGLAAIAGAGEFRDRYVEAFSRSDFEAMLHYYKANYPREPYEEEDAPTTPIAAPVLVIHGLSDVFLLAEGHDRNWQWLESDYTLMTLPGVGHFVMREAGDAVTRAIRVWLER